MIRHDYAPTPRTWRDFMPSASLQIVAYVVALLLSGCSGSQAQCISQGGSASAIAMPIYRVSVSGTPYIVGYEVVHSCDQPKRPD